jgi:hypothetical protein
MYAITAAIIIGDMILKNIPTADMIASIFITALKTITAAATNSKP